MKSIGLYMALPLGLNFYIVIYRENLKNILIENCYAKWDNV